MDSTDPAERAVGPARPPLSATPPPVPLASGLRLRLLGPPRIALHGVPLAFTRRKAAALLIYLAVTGRPHARESLAALFWGELPGHSAAANLRKVLTELRERVGDRLLSDREAVGLDFGRGVWLDAAAFNAAVEAAAAAADPAALQAAVALYEADFLAGFALPDAPDFDEWSLLRREHLRDRLLEALQALTDLHVRRGETAAGIASATRLLALDTWREEAHRALMTLLARAGRRDAALAQYETCRRALAEGLGVEPLPETAALHERLQRGAPAPPHNLPAPPGPFVGRRAERALLAERLADPACRLVTLVGLGGSGKTRLALEAAHAAAPAVPGSGRSFPDGVYLVAPRDERALAGPDARRLLAAIAGALGLPSPGAMEPGGWARAHLATRAVLLVLDGLEPVPAAAAALDDLLKRAPGVALLVTARAALGLEAEWTLRLGGLALPGGEDDLERSEAGQLFLQRARQVRPSFALTAADRPAVARVCALTGGLPLALLLAAEGLRGLNCAGLAAELERGLDVLEAPAGVVPARRRSVRAILVAAWRGLPPARRAALRRLAAFPGGFTGEVARAVAGVAPADLLALVDATLVTLDADGRHDLPPLVRQRAAGQLAARPDEAALAAARHAAYYADFARRRTDALYRELEAADAFRADFANLRAAWDWAADHARLDLLESLREGLVVFCDNAGWSAEGEAAFARAVERLRAVSGAAGAAPGYQAVLGFLLTEHARFLIRQARHDRAWSALEEARALAGAAGSAALAVQYARYRGEWFRERRGYPAARQALARATDLARAAGLRRPEAASLRTLGEVVALLGGGAGARDCGERALALCRELGDRLGEGRAYRLLGRLAAARGEYAPAALYQEQDLRLSRALGDRLGESIALNYRAALADAIEGRYLEAEEMLARALALCRDLADRRHEGATLANLARNARLRGDYARARECGEGAVWICQELGDRAGVGRRVRDLGQLARDLGREREALALSGQALRIAEEEGDSLARGWALLLRGDALAAAGHLAGADDAYRRAVGSELARGAPSLALAATAGLSGVALARRDLPGAVRGVETIWECLRARTLAGVEEPARLAVTCARVLRAAGDPRAAAILAAGRDLVLARAAQFAEGARRRFLEAIPAHRELLRPWDHEGPGEALLVDLVVGVAAHGAHPVG